MGCRICPCFVLILRLCLVDCKDHASPVLLSLWHPFNHFCLEFPCLLWASAGVTVGRFSLFSSLCVPHRSTHVLLLLSLTSGLPVTPQTAFPGTAAPGDSKMRAWGSARHLPSAALWRVSVGRSVESLSQTGDAVAARTGWWLKALPRRQLRTTGTKQPGALRWHHRAEFCWRVKWAAGVERATQGPCWGTGASFSATRRPVESFTPESVPARHAV